MRRLTILRTAIAGCGLLLLAACATPALERTGHLPGDRFVYVDARGRETVREVVRVDGERVTWRTDRGVTFVKVDPFVPMVAWDGRRTRGRTVALEVRGDLHPARKGSRRTVRVTYEVIRKKDGRRTRRTELWRCRAAGARERVVPAGVFPTWKVVCRRHDPETGEVLRTHVWYWSSGLGHWVERSKKWADGRRERLKLVRVERAGTGPRGRR